MDADLTYLLERQSVVDTVVGYATGIDLHQWDLYRTIFTDVCHYDFSSWNGNPGADIPADQWVAGVRAALSGFQATQHIIVPYTIEFSGPDEATSIAYMYAQHFLPNDKGDSWL